MNKIVKGTASFLAFPFLKLYRQTLIRLFKNEALGYYLKTVKTARSIFIATLLLFSFLGFLVSGFVMVHIAGYIYIAINKNNPELALLVLSVLGALYLFISLIILLFACSEKNWLKYSKYNEYSR